MSDVEQITSVTKTNKPESQSVSKCAALREDCQAKIFNKMDALHEKQMDAIGEIKTQIAFQKGKDAAIVPIAKDEDGKRDWIDIAIRFIIAWGPWIMAVFLTGLIALLKSKDILG